MEPGGKAVPGVYHTALEIWSNELNWPRLALGHPFYRINNPCMACVRLVECVAAVLESTLSTTEGTHELIAARCSGYLVYILYASTRTYVTEDK